MEMIEGVTSGAPFVTDASAFEVSVMTLADVPAVMEIERTAFPLPWPEQAYRYELTQNPNAYFIVARARSSTAAPAVPTRIRQPGLLQRILGVRPAMSSPSAAADLVVGYAGMWMFVDEAHISTIASHPTWRGHGVGELMLLSLIREADHRSAIIVTLEVRVSNTVAQNLYVKYGFEEVGVRKRYYRDNGEDALIMTVQHFQRPEYRQRLDELEQALQDRLQRR